jgi:multidrug efflux system membrane fusion protein
LILMKKPAFGFLAVTLSVLSFSACKSETAPVQRKQSVPVAVARVVEKSVPLQIKVIGNVEAYSTIAVKAQIGGELVTVSFREGQDVKKGDLLFQIDARPYEQALRQAEANLARDTALTRQAEANLARDMAQAKNADSQATRYAQLTKEGVISKEQNDQVRTSADAMTESTRADQAAIESSRAAANADRAAVDRAKLDIAYCSIRSPIDGRTGNVMVKEGNLVKANADTAMVQINQVVPVYVTFSVPEQQLSDIRKYMASHQLAVEAAIPNTDHPARNGILTFVDNSVDSTTGTIKLKATFPNSDKILWPGQFVNVVLTLGTDRNVTVVPSEAVQTGQKGQFVYVVKADNTVENRLLVIGRVLDRETIVDKGLSPGETVVTDGQLRLIPGATVEVANAPATAGAPKNSEAAQ